MWAPSTTVANRSGITRPFYKNYKPQSKSELVEYDFDYFGPA